MAVLPSARLCVRVILIGTAVLFYTLSRTPAPSAPPEKPPLPFGAERWHAVTRGQGVKVAVLDTGFRGYRDHLGRALPASITIRSFRRDGNLEARDSDHGVACAEVIHALAPDAELLFATWEPDEPETFVEAVRWCRDQGANIISCSVIMPAWSDGEGGGSVHARLAEILGAAKRGDLLAFACAGNLAQRHWAGRFSDSGKGVHRWAAGRTENRIAPWGDERVSVELCWHGEARYAIEVLDATAGKMVGTTTAHAGPDRRAITARFQPQTGHSYRLRVRLRGGNPGRFHLSALGGWLEHFTTAGSIPFPGDGAEWVTVAAVDDAGARAAYSSCGPNSHRPKPDLAAPVPFPVTSRSRPFAGTSAATPQAAGLAALIWARRPTLMAHGVRDVLVKACRDLGPDGHDTETGFGMIRLP